MKFFVFVLCLAGVAVGRELPSFIKVCKPKETDVSKCVMRNVELLKPKLQAGGVPEMALPSLNPLVLSQANLEVGTFKFAMKNLKVYDAGNFDLEQLKIDLDEDKFNIKLKIPLLHVITDYTIKGKLLVLTLDGSGQGTINITDLSTTVDATVKRVTRRGKVYLSLNTLDIKPVVGGLSLNLENLFKDNPELTAQSNKVLNDSGSALIEDFTPLVVNIIKDFLTKLVRNIFDHYSFNTLFPSN